jgi:thiopeptide-type bacteriocin biosynthesis protein
MDLAVLRNCLDASGGPAVLTESWAPDDHAWCGGRAHEIVIPLAATAPPGPPPKALARRGPLPSAGRDHGNLPGSGGVLSARLYSDPALFDLIVTDHIPVLIGGWDGLSLWWFIRYRGRDPRHHLRLRLHAADCGQAAVRTGQWAATLRSQGLAADLVLDTYRPETGRFGTGPVLAAAETLFAADSVAAAAQLAATGTADPRALTAASLADLAAALLGGRHVGLQWLAAHPEPAGPAPLDRDARRQALTMSSTTSGDALPAAVCRAWSARADAAGQYARQLTEAGRDPAGILDSLLHLHHNRVHGPGLDAEAVTYRLARACALRHIARTSAAGETGSP